MFIQFKMENRWKYIKISAINNIFLDYFVNTANIVTFSHKVSTDVSTFDNLYQIGRAHV